MTAAREAFFRRDGDGFMPTGVGISPWDDRSQSGVSLAGLVAAVLEAVPAQSPMLTTRVTIDIMGAVPMERLTPVIRVLRDGPRMQLLETELCGGGKTWVRTTALRARLGESPTITQPLTHPFREDAEVEHSLPWCTMVRAAGAFNQKGAGAIWVHMIADVIEGEPLTPMQRIATVSDFGSGAAPMVSFRKWTSANLDIVLNLSRPPEGDWLLVDATSESAGNGIGVASARIGDLGGMFATTAQTLFLNPRPQRP